MSSEYIEKMQCVIANIATEYTLYNQLFVNSDAIHLLNKTAPKIQYLSLNNDGLTLLMKQLWQLVDMIRYAVGETGVLITTGPEIIMYNDGDSLLYNFRKLRMAN